MTTRTLKTGETVRAHRNEGLRKRCGCPRRAWTKCPHPWHANFTPPGLREQRVSLHRYARKPHSYVMLKTEAERLFTAWKSALLDGKRPTPAPTAGRLFSAVCDDYLRLHVRQPQRRPGGVVEMARLVVLLKTAFGAQLLATVDKPAIEAWRATRRERVSARVWVKNGEVATNRLLSRLRHIFAWAILEGYTDTTPFMKGGVTMIKTNSTVEQPRQRRLEGDEEVRLLAAAGVHMRDLIVAALETGMRRGELLGLQWQHVKLPDGLIILPPEVTKTGRGRAVPISLNLRAVLEMRQTGPDAEPHAADRFVFGNEVGDRARSVKTAWAATCRRAGITGLHFHDLRREAGSRLLEVPGVNLTDARDWLGHRSVTQTNTYLNTTVMRLRQVMAKVEDARKPKANGPTPDEDEQGTGRPARTPLAHEEAAPNVAAASLASNLVN